MITIDGNNARFHCLLSSYVNIVGGLLDLFLSMKAGAQEESFSMFGVALMSFIDIAGSLLVLIRWQFQFSDIPDHQGERLREMKLSCVLGFLMSVLGVFLLNRCTWSLLSHSSPHDLSRGLAIAIFGTVLSLGLAWYKFLVGRKLDSYVVLTDAMCSLCVGLTCLPSILVDLLEPFWWWSDGAIGLVVAAYTLYGGVKTCLYAYPEYVHLSKCLTEGLLFDRRHRKPSETTRLLLNDDHEEAPESQEESYTNRTNHPSSSQANSDDHNRHRSLPFISTHPLINPFSTSGRSFLDALRSVFVGSSSRSLSTSLVASPGGALGSSGGGREGAFVYDNGFVGADDDGNSAEV